MAETGFQIKGDVKSGFYAAIMADGHEIADFKDGEFSLQTMSSDQTVSEGLPGFKGNGYSVQDGQAIISGQIPLGNHAVTVNATVIYQKINDHVIKKTIRLKQNNVRDLLYSLETRLLPVHAPETYLSFENDNSPGGSIVEIYPALGFSAGNGLVCGLLTDAGFRNLWTRNIRKRAVVSPFDVSGFTATGIMPDLQLTSMADHASRQKGNHYLALKFGELIDFTHGCSEEVSLDDSDQWKVIGTAEVKSLAAETRILCKKDRIGLSGVAIPLPVRSGLYYSLEFDYSGDASRLSTRLKAADGEKDLGLYNDLLKCREDQWSTFSGDFFVPPGEDCQEPFKFLISAGYDLKNGLYNLRIRNLKLSIHQAQTRPYHHLMMNQTIEKNVFIFVDQCNSLADFRRAAQIRLAEGVGFEGPAEQKMLFADLQMLIWIADHQDQTAHLVPSLVYSPDMYNRDSFWAALSVDDRSLHETLWNKWAATQNAEGGIGTIITPHVGCDENTANDATLCFMIWAYVNHVRYGTPLDRHVLSSALEFCRKSFPLDDSGFCQATTPLCQMDVMWTHDEMQIYAVNQGMMAVVLRCCLQMGLDVTEAEIGQLEERYRSMYDPARGYIISWKKRPEIIALYDLMPEFLSLWLFNRPILSDEMVIRTLKKFPLINHCLPIMCLADGQFFAQQNHPWDQEDIRWQAGEYYNGGSWLRVEYLAYVAAEKHGWTEAAGRRKRRLETEFTMFPDEPFSHEWLPCAENVKLNMSKVFAWNAFVIIADQLVTGKWPGSERSR